MTTLKQLCHSWLASLPAWPECARAGGGLTATVVTKRLLYPDLVARWDVASLLTAPSLTAPLDDEQAAHAGLLLQWAGKRVERQIRLVRGGIDEGMAAARVRNVEVSVTQLADKLARAIQSIEAAGEPVTEMELAAVVSTYLSNCPPRGRVLSRPDFAPYEPTFLRSWARVGATNLAAFSYRALALGADDRPPFILRGRESTWDGLGRSVYSRFRMAAGDARVAGSATEVAHAEIERACGRLGLRQEAGVVALHSLFAGFLYAPLDSGTWLRPTDLTVDQTWRRDPRPLRPCEPTSADPLRPRGPWAHGDMAAYAQACVAVFVGREVQGRYLRLKGLMDDAREHAMRRAWMICFEHDRRHLDITGATGAKMVSIAVFKGIPTGQAHRHDRRLVAIERAPLPSDDPTAEAAIEGPSVQAPTGRPVDPARISASLALLAENPDLAHDLVYGREDAVADYERRVQSDGLVPLDDLLRFLMKDDES
ncbi:MAG: hypothetical protein IPL36_14290 [Nigerium sp.]|nr:hypothetical protein [Nigerium sp.]